MGGCLSAPGGCGPVKTRLRRRRTTKLLESRKSRGLGYSKVSKDVSDDSEQLDMESTVEGSEAWLEPNPLYESNSDSDDEYHSVPDMLNDSEESSSTELLSPKDATNDEKNPNIHPYFSSNLMTVQNDLQSKNMTHSYSSDPVFSNDVAYKSEASAFSAKRRVAPDPFMPLEVQNNAMSHSGIVIRKRPVAGTQFPICPRGKEMLDSWSPIEPSTFRMRGMNYLSFVLPKIKDKKKEHASSKAAYYPFGADVYLSHRKVKHIARHVELPPISSSSTLPAMLVVNVQIPLYAPSIFQNENDGEGMNVVMYFKLSEKIEKELPTHFQESIKRLIDDETETAKGFPMDTTVPFRERLKILGRVVNVDDLQLNAAQRKVVHAYNQKPFLSRPQHEFYSGENYFEIDLDMHRFSHISRKGFDAFQDQLKICILDVGLAIQGNKTEELPEHVLCCMRINGIDHTNYRHLESSEEIL